MNANDKSAIAERIRTKYTEKEPTDLDELRELDKTVKRPAAIFAYVFGVISAIITGMGMSLVMTDVGTTLGIADPMFPGIIIGVIGLAFALLNYPLYSKILSVRRATYAPRIMELSGRIIEE